MVRTEGFHCSPVVRIEGLHTPVVRIEGLHTPVVRIEGFHCSLVYAVTNHSNESFLIGHVNSKINHAMNIVITNKSTQSADYYKLLDKNTVVHSAVNHK